MRAGYHTIRAIISTLSLFVAVAALAGCGLFDRLEREINSKWPPLELADQQSRGLDVAEQALRSAEGAQLAVVLDADPVETEAEVRLSARLPQLSNVDVTFDRQAAKVSADFKLNIDGGKLTLAGTAIAGASLAVAPDHIILLPAFETVRVKDVTYKGIDAGAVLPLAQRALDRFLRNLNGEIQKQPEFRVPISYSLSESFNLDRLSGASASMPGVVATGDVTAELHVRTLVPVFHKDYIGLMVEIRPRQGVVIGSQPTSTRGASEADIDQRFERFESQFLSRLNDFGAEIEPGSGSSFIAVRKQFISELVNQTFSKVNLCVSASDLNQRISIPATEIEPFKDTVELDCSPTRQCNIDNQCRLQEDTRDCRHCLVRRPWDGRCAQYWNEPTCEISKATQNQLYLASFNTCKANESLEKFDCERIKTTEKLGCEANKEWLKRVRNVGTIGQIEGDVTATGNLGMCVQNLQLAPDLSNAAMEAAIDGNLNLNGDLKFVPKSLGFLVCVSQWKEPFHAKATINRQRFRVATDLSWSNEHDELEMKGTTREFGLKFETAPPPFDAVFEQNRHLYVVCQPAGVAKLANITSKALTGDDLAPAFSGLMEQKVPSQSFSILFKPRSLQIGDRRFVGKAAERGNALVYSLTPEA